MPRGPALTPQVKHAAMDCNLVKRKLIQLLVRNDSADPKIIVFIEPVFPLSVILLEHVRRVDTSPFFQDLRAAWVEIYVVCVLVRFRAKDASIPEGLPVRS